MKTMSVKLDDSKIEKLTSIARSKGETPVELMNEIIDRFLSETETRNELEAIMTLSEKSFSDWDNDDDTIYDTL